VAAVLDPGQHSPSGRHALRDRLSAVGASATLVASLLVVAAIGAPTVLAAAPDHFVVSVSGDQVAGAPFDVTVTAEDASNVADPLYTGGAVLSGLAASPGCGDCNPGLTGIAPDYGTAPSTWVDGVGTFTGVVAYNAEPGATVTATDDTAIGTSDPFAVSPAADLAGFTIGSISSQIAGATTTVTVTAYDLYGNVNSNYDGTSTAALSGLATSPGCGGCNPLIPTSAASYGSSSWAAGVGSWTGATPFKADTLAQLTVTDSSASVSNTSNIFNVDNGTILGGFTIDSVGTTHTAGGSFPVTIHAYDLYGNPKLDYTGGAVLDGLATSPGCSGCVPGLTATPADYGTISWANGVGTTSVTAFNAQSGAQLTITDGSISNTSNTFDVNPATALKGFTFTTVGTKTAGATTTVTVTAYDLYGNVNSNYDGTSTAALSGLATSPGCGRGNPLTATPATYGTPSWTNGISTFSGVLAYKAAASAVTVTAGSVSNTSNTFTVNPATALKGLTVANVNTQTAGNGFNPVVTAYDLYGNVNTNYGGGAILSGLATSPGCSGCTPVLTTTAATYGTPSWTLGVGTFSGVLAYKAASSTLTVTDSSASVSNASNSFTVNPALALKGFTVAHVNDQTAGAVGGFSVVVTAYDLYGNLNTNYSGGAALSGLATSPGCTGCSPNLPAKVATYGSPSWVGGVGTFSGVLAYKATKSDSATNVTHVTVMDTPASVSAVTNDFVVSPALVNALWFNAQPIDAQVNSAAAPTAVYALCAPSTTAPCALAGTPPAGSGAVAVTAVDAFGNLVLAQNIVMSGTGLDTNVTRPTAGGVATFGDALKESTTGNGRTLVATAALNGSANKTSGVFRVVTTLKGCAANNTKCINKALGNTNSKTYVNSWSQITTGTCFYCGTTNVLQSTQLVVNSTAPQCGITAFASDQVDQRVTGSNTQVTSSGLELIVIPKNTLKSSGFLNRSPSNFNVCFGAIWIGAGSPPQGWLGKTGATNNTPLRASPVDDQTVVPQGQRWYGIPADCGTAGLSSSDPCILKRTKQKSDIQTLLGADAASIMTDADLGIVIRVGGSWDGGSHPF